MDERRREQEGSARHIVRHGPYSIISCRAHSGNTVRDVSAFVDTDNRAALFLLSKSCFLPLASELFQMALEISFAEEEEEEVFMKIIKCNIKKSAV